MPEYASTLQTRPSLLFRLRNWDDSGTWEEFNRLYRRLVYNFARKSGLAREEAEEVTQDVFVRVAKTIHEFEANSERGSFRGWLLNLTRWRVTDKFRERKARADGQPAESLADMPAPDQFELQWDGEWRSQILEAALARVCQQTQARHFQIFELYFRHHWPVLQIARKLQVNPAAVYLISHRLTKRLKAEVAALEKILA